MRLDLSAQQYAQILSHLLPEDSILEQAGYLFVKQESGILKTQEIYLMTEHDFLRQQSDYLELADEVRAKLIKRAHDTNTCLVEMHSHPGPWPAMFSSADFMGLDETVPHMAWRLPGKLYAALVFARGSFDGLIWVPQQKQPQQLTEILVDGCSVCPTNKSISYLSKWENFYV